MRALIICLALLVSAAICTGILAVFAGIGLDSTTLAVLGIGLFMVGSLFAAISALGPKWRPTPFLTPAMAGTIATFAITIAVIAGSQHIQRAALHTSEPPKITEPAPAASPPDPAMQPPAMPEPAGAPVRMAEPSAPTAAENPQLAPPPIMPAPIEEPQVEPPPEVTLEAANSVITDDIGSDFELPPLQIAPATNGEPAASALIPGAPAEIPVVAPAGAAAPAADATFAATGTAAPVPTPRPPQPSALVPQAPASAAVPPNTLQPAGTVSLSQDNFDAAGGPAATPSPPAPTTTVNPPLPRSRPCGAGGPPCP